MVLIFIKRPEGQILSLDVSFNAKVKHLKKLISKSWQFQRRHQKLIFGGRLLKNEDRLCDYNISKECTVQLIVSNPKLEEHSRSATHSRSPLSSSSAVHEAKPHSNNNTNTNTNTNNNHNGSHTKRFSSTSNPGCNDHSHSHSHSHSSRQAISPYLQFGDLVLVQLIEAKALKKSDFWTGSSDPYVLLAMNSFSTKSKIIKRNINPKWNELFCFGIDSQKQFPANLNRDTIGGNAHDLSQKKGKPPRSRSRSRLQRKKLEEMQAFHQKQQQRLLMNNNINKNKNSNQNNNNNNNKMNNNQDPEQPQPPQPPAPPAVNNEDKKKKKKKKNNNNNKNNKKVIAGEMTQLHHSIHHIHNGSHNNYRYYNNNGCHGHHGSGSNSGHLMNHQNGYNNHNHNGNHGGGGGGYYMNGGASNILSFLVFDHDTFTPDDFLGSAEICLDSLPYNTTIDLWIPLEQIETGHLHIKLKRCALPSPMHRSIVYRLMSLERSIMMSDLQSHGISMDQLIGQEAWIRNQSNPALEHLVSVLVSNKLEWKLNTLRRIESILSSQHMLVSNGIPTRYLWFSGLAFDDDSYSGSGASTTTKPTSAATTSTAVAVSSSMAAATSTEPPSSPVFTKQDFLLAIEQYVIPKRVWIPKTKAAEPALLSFALIELKSIRDALFIFMTFQHKKIFVRNKPERASETEKKRQQSQSASQLNKENMNIESNRRSGSTGSGDHATEHKQQSQSQSQSQSQLGRHAGKDGGKKLKKSRMLLGFGRRLVFDGLFLEDAKMAGFLNICCSLSNVVVTVCEEPKWQLCWCFLKSTQLLCYDNLQSEHALYAINFRSDDDHKSQMHNLLICERSQYSIEMIDRSSSLSYFVYSHSKQQMQIWKNIFEETNKLCASVTANANANANAPSSTTTTTATTTTTTTKQETTAAADTVDKYIDRNHCDIFVECHLCHHKKPLNRMLSPDISSQFSCIACLRGDIVANLNLSTVQYISKQYSIQDLMELLTADELSAYLDLKLDELLQSADNFIQCPHCQSTWEFIGGDIKYDAPDFSRELGMNNKLLDNASQMHYLQHRVCCRACNKNFCRSCQLMPYHVGFSCDLYQTYLEAEKCRFCTAALMPGEIAPPMMDGAEQKDGGTGARVQFITPPALQNVCNNECCLSKRALACHEMLPCGHPCNGSLDERHCMSCIHEDCAGRKAYVTQLADDYCNICYTEELYEAPCVELDCGHIFHFECIKYRLGAGSNDEAAVNFSYAKCPLCKMFIGHSNLLQSELQTVQSLYRDLEMRAYQQLKEDGLLRTPHITEEFAIVDDGDGNGEVERTRPMNDDFLDSSDRDDSDDSDDGNADTNGKREKKAAVMRTKIKAKPGPARARQKNKFFQNAVGYAMKRYAFYNCNICKKPYYGGLANCRDIAMGLNASDFVCPACSGIGMDSCQIHGQDYMLYKCKFCCSVATYFCWGTTHFCIACHQKQENHDFMTTKAKKDLPVCESAQQCPLKVDHPPNGEEFSLGCSLCRGTDNFVSQETNPPQDDEEAEEAEEADAKNNADANDGGNGDDGNKNDNKNNDNDSDSDSDSDGDEGEIA